MKPNGEELASFTGGDADELESDPAATAVAARQLARPRGRRRARHARRQRRRPGHRRGRVARHPAPDHRRQHRGCGRLQPLRLPARRHPGPRAPDRLALAVAYGSAAAGLPGTTIPSPHSSAPSWSASPPLRRHHMTDLITTDLVRLGRRLGRGQARRDPRARRRRRRRRTRDRRGPARRGRVRPRGHLLAPACPAASPSPTAAPPASTSRRWPSPGSSPRSTSAPRTARPTSPS